MKFRSQFALPAFLLLMSSAQFAQAASPDGIQLTVEPIVGYERVQKIAPTPHSKDRLMYGARVSAGWKIIAAEAELTRGTDTDSYPQQGYSNQETDDRLKLGLRSSAQLSTLIMGSLRGGVQATRRRQDITQSGATTRTTSPLAYDPYAGLGVSSEVGHNFTLTGGITVVFGDFPHMQRNEYQTTLGFNVSFP